MLLDLSLPLVCTMTVLAMCGIIGTRKESYMVQRYTNLDQQQDSLIATARKSCDRLMLETP
jgi:hypothetical protein